MKMDAVVRRANRSLWSRLGNSVPKPSRDHRERLPAEGWLLTAFSTEWMRQPSTVACLLLAIAAAALASEGRDVVDYRISARLLAKEHAIDGREILTWRNKSPNLVGELQFHLYMNAFRNDKSTFAREEGRGEERVKEEGRGWIDIRRIQVAGGADLTKAIRFIHPDDDNADDRTVISVPLPAAVHPGQSITLEIDFYTRLPHVAARAGYHGDFHMVAQWFPKIGVWEAAGERYSTYGRWNCHQYHATSEFYADYGRYEVTITAPENYVVGATGAGTAQLRDPLFAPGTGMATRRFVQADVHDFAWTAQPGFLRVERTFDPDREVSAGEVAATAKVLGLGEAEVRLKPVQMILLIQPEHASQIERHFKALRTAIKYFGLWYGPYPYKTITVVDPPYGGHEAGGMEYPTLITAGTAWIAAPGEQTPEGVIVHEYGHQYWYGLVGNNEFEESWLDEGFNTYSTDKILDLAYGPEHWPIRLLGVPLGAFFGTPRFLHDSANRGGYLLDPKADAMLRNSWEYYDHVSYGLNSYLRPGITLRTLENYLGAPVMARIMRAYHQRWRYRHPTSLDFLAVVNEISGRDMKWFFDQFVFGSNVLDYGVSEVRSKKAGARNYESTVRIRREGEAVFPVEVRIRFKDGKVEERQWDGQYRWTEFKFTRPAAIESVEIDPGRKILLDADFANNSRTETLQAKPLMKWTENLVFWAEQILLAIAGVS
jgi:hypothetical protein